MDNLFKKLDSLIDKYDHFIIMSHANPDLDALGSSLALYYKIMSMGKVADIFLDAGDLTKYNDTIKKSIPKLNNVRFVNDKTYRVDNKTLLFILDVHAKKRLEYPSILDSDINVCVIDHHIKSRDYIKNTVCTYIDSNMSSMVEIMINYIVYSNIELDSITSSIMLAGMEIDTNDYNLKTTAKTYQAASYLMDNHADIILKQQLLKESKDEYIKRADYIRHSFKVGSNIAMCVLVDELETEELAEIADDLLKFSDVEASFALSPIKDGKIGISARSIGNINVEKIMSQLGGGGSKTNAAAQVNKSLRDVKRQIIKLVG